MTRTYRQLHALRSGMTAYEQKITRFLGHAQRLGVSFEPRSLFMLSFSGQVLLSLAKECNAVTEPQSERALIKKAQRVVAAVRALLDELDRVLDEALLTNQPRTLRLHAPCFKSLMKVSPRR